MEFENYVKENINLFSDEDDEILLNPIKFINQFENYDINIHPNKNDLIPQNQTVAQNNKSQSSNNNNSTLNTNAALDGNSQNINYNISFFSFNGNKKMDEKKEMSEKSMEILTEFISKEKIITQNDNMIRKENTKIKKYLIKELKNDLINLEDSIKIYFKKPFMRKNYVKTNINKKFELKKDEEEDEDEEKKMGDYNEINEKVNCKDNTIKEININNRIDINEL